MEEFLSKRNLSLNYNVWSPAWGFEAVVDQWNISVRISAMKFDRWIMYQGPFLNYTNVTEDKYAAYDISLNIQKIECSTHTQEFNYRLKGYPFTPKGFLPPNAQWVQLYECLKLRIILISTATEETAWWIFIFFFNVLNWVFVFDQGSIKSIKVFKVLIEMLMKLNGQLIPGFIPHLRYSFCLSFKNLIWF